MYFCVFLWINKVLIIGRLDSRRALGSTYHEYLEQQVATIIARPSTHKPVFCSVLKYPQAMARFGHSVMGVGLRAHYYFKSTHSKVRPQHPW